MRLRAILLPLIACVFSAEAQTPYSETIDVEVVTVDVVVVDRDGNRVPGLGKEDFELFANGQRVEISNFSAYFAPQSPLPGQKPVAEAAVESVKPPPVTWIVYVDLMRTTWAQRLTAIRSVRKFLDAAVRPGERLLVSSFDGKAFRVAQPLTTDVRLAAQSLRKLESRLPAGEFATFTLLQGPAAPETDLGDDETERRIRSAIDGLDNLASVAEGVPGRIGLLFVGGGYNMAELSNAANTDRAGRLHTRYQNVLARLGEGRFTAYTIFSGGRLAGFGSDLPQEAEPAVDSPPQNRTAVDATSEISAFAAVTGGASFIASAGLDERLRRVRDDFESYYSLGFRPSSRSSGRRSFKIEVRARGEGLRVRHRMMVGVRTDEQSSKDATLAALLSDDEPDNPFQVRMDIGKIRPARGRTYIAPLVVSIPSANLTSRNLSLHFAVRDAAGNYQLLEARELSIPATAGKTISYRVEVLMASGSHSLAVTVHDRQGRAYSTVRRTINAR